MPDHTLLETPYFRLEPVVAGVYAAIVVPGSGAWGNAGIVDLGDGALVFDTFFTPPAAEALRAAAERVTGHPVTTVVNSHNHADHVFGNAVFTGATIIATERTRELIADRAPAFLAQAQAHPEYLDELAQQAEQEANPHTRRELTTMLGNYRALQPLLATLPLRLPDVTFDSRLTVHGLARRAEVITYGGGHTPSDAFLYLPDDHVAFMGDLVQINFHPMMSQGDPDQWDRILAQVAALAPAHVVPGHGPVGSGAAVAAQRRYFADLRDQVRAHREAGRGAEALATVPIPAAYADWDPASGFHANLHFLYERSEPAGE